MIFLIDGKLLRRILVNREFVNFLLTFLAKTDLIICIGTSLKVLKAYKVLWPKKCKLVIINLQWTPKDKKADLLIRGQSDQILCEVAKAFDVAIPSYSENDDPLISLATALSENDPKPSTPFLNMVENNPKFQGDLYLENFARND